MRILSVIFKSYKELSRIPTFKERFEYLKLGAIVGEETFGFDRYLNQVLYRSPEWKSVRASVIVRDNGMDMGLDGYPIGNRILVHHINPLTLEDIDERSSVIFDLDNLVCVSHTTHNAIHFGDASLLPKEPIERKPNDTCPWK